MVSLNKDVIKALFFPLCTCAIFALGQFFPLVLGFHYFGLNLISFVLGGAENKHMQTYFSGTVY